jgi:hypothetical protein
VSFRVVYDVAVDGDYQLGFLGVGALCAFFGAIFFKDRCQLTARQRLVCYLVCLAAVANLAIFGFANRERIVLVRSLHEGRCKVIEGKVENFVPMPEGGHREGEFSVGDQRFHYSDFRECAGFHNSASYGGPIRLGIYVRIHYIGDNIAKLEVRDR